MAVMFAVELFLSFVTLTGLWYGQEKFDYPALLILPLRKTPTKSIGRQ
jgi:hypothetical protein